MLSRLFARNLRQMRQTKKLSQGALADRVGVTTSYVSMLERGLRSPPLETVERVARGLRVHPLSLLAATGSIYAAPEKVTP